MSRTMQTAKNSGLLLLLGILAPTLALAEDGSCSCGRDPYLWIPAIPPGC
jgi:hypothetical protein